MAFATFANLNASSSHWIGHQSFNRRPASFSCSSACRVSVIHAGLYSDELVKTAKTIASPDRGILAINESNATCGKRLASIGLDNTEVNRQAYRQLLLTTPGLGQYISGATLFRRPYISQQLMVRRWLTACVNRTSCPASKLTRHAV